MIIAQMIAVINGRRIQKLEAMRIPINNTARVVRVTSRVFQLFVGIFVLLGKDFVASIQYLRLSAVRITPLSIIAEQCPAYMLFIIRWKGRQLVIFPVKASRQEEQRVGNDHHFFSAGADG
jgi:hypothetical protein